MTTANRTVRIPLDLTESGQQHLRQILENTSTAENEPLNTAGTIPNNPATFIRLKVRKTLYTTSYEIKQLHSNPVEKPLNM
jgi:hypothetical protein